MTTNDHILKLTGKVSLLEPIELGHNYSIKIGGSITSITDSDNNDGTINRYYRFEPINVELLDPLGKRIKATDPRSQSKKLRSAIWREWSHGEFTLNDEQLYEKVMDWAISHADMLVSAALEK